MKMQKKLNEPATKSTEPATLLPVRSTLSPVRFDLNKNIVFLSTFDFVASVYTGLKNPAQTQIALERHGLTFLKHKILLSKINVGVNAREDNPTLVKQPTST